MMHVPTTHMPTTTSEPPSSGGRLVTSTGRALPLLGTVLSSDAEGGIARVTLEQRFRNPHAEPLAVTYSLPLPADGAVSGFAFTIGDRRVKGEIDRKKAARERYEQALVEGKSAALLEQDRSSLFTQEIGNIPPGVEVIVEVSIDQRLRWIDEGAWEWRFPTVVAPRYLGEPGRVADAARVTQDVADGPLPARFALSCTVRDRIALGRRPESPSHAIETLEGEDGLRVALREKAGARLDRDVVVRWAVATPKVGVSLATCRPGIGRAIGRNGYGLLTVVPPSVEGRYRPVPRDLIVLVDTSGSMGGEPLAQAARVVSAIVETMRDQDQIELIEFGSAPRRWKAHPVSATASARREAIAWLHALRASGATEMRSAIVEALSGVRPGAQRQIVLVTDGLIGFESQVVQAICDRLPVSSRLHTVGVGSAVNRSLTGPAARAGHGVEVVIGVGEDPERAAARIVARTSEPLLVDLAISGPALVEHAPSRLPDLFAGAPALIGVALRPEGGEILVRGRTPEGSWEQRLRVPSLDYASGNAGIAALFGREAVEDLEMRLAGGGDGREIDREIERIGIEFQISTRLTSWVAVSEEQTVDPGDPLRRERMPHELPYGMSAEGVGLRPAMPVAPMMAAAPASIAAPAAAPMGRARASVELKARLGKTTQGAPPPSPARMPPPPPKPVEAAPMTPPPLSAPGMAPPAAREADDEARSMGAVGRAAAADEGASGGERAKGRGIIGAIKDFFGGRSEEEAAPAPAMPAPAKAMKKEAAPAEKAAVKRDEPARGSRVLRGRVALHRNGLLVIGIVAEGAPLDWSPAAEAQVELVTGHAFTVKLDAGRSTRAGAVPVGATARLALALPQGEPLDTVLRVTIALGGDIVVIEV
ncbi:MAG: VIT domain-containing protein [Minicystis sp.]